MESKDKRRKGEERSRMKKRLKESQRKEKSRKGEEMSTMKKKAKRKTKERSGE